MIYSNEPPCDYNRFQMFNDWLLEQLNKTGWSQADLSRKSGLTKGAISNYINGRIPDKDAVKKLAKAFNLPSETIYRAAGILPTKSPETELIQRIIHLTSELPEQDQADILAYTQLRHRLAEERGKYETKPTRKTTPKPGKA